jgi:NADPH:quinone reductase-like Zn-dependent oxidoreductase
MMKAITRTQYGSPEVLELKEIAKPIPKANEILIRVYATTVNRTDGGILTGKPFAIQFFTGLKNPRDLVPGTDFAGQIEAIGSKVKNFKIGDRVWGLNDQGCRSQAQNMTIAENQAISPIPDGISYQEAVACAEGAHYAYNFVNKVKLSTETKVLVNGATGAIGSAAVQLLRYYGCYITAVGNTKNLDLLAALGADKVINYEKDDFTLDKERYDLVFDTAGNKSFDECKQLLNPKGVYISSELGPNAENLYLPLFTIGKGKRVIFPIPTNPKRSVLFINQLLEKGEFRAVIDKTYQMEQIKDAYVYMMSGQKTGNVIVEY